MMTTIEPERDLFEGADSAASILAFVHAECGEAGLRQLPTMTDCDRESLERDALELEQIGLLRPAKIVLEHAQQSQAAIERWNPYPEHDHANYISWREGHLRRQGYSCNPATDR